MVQKQFYMNYKKRFLFCEVEVSNQLILYEISHGSSIVTILPLGEKIILLL